MLAKMREVVIASSVRTPIGSFNGSLSPLSATQLGSVVIAEAVRRAGLKGDEIDEVIMGNVISAGLGQAPARQASLGAGLPEGVGCTMVNKVCGSGLKAVIMAAQAIRLGDADTVVVGGMESMSNAPYLLEKARRGYRMGHDMLVDSAIKDGLWDPYNDFHMGSAAELCAEKFEISRVDQDRFAFASYERAQAAQRRGDFMQEIVGVSVSQKTGEIVVSEDEEIKKFQPEKLGRLKAAFKENGTVTAGNASSLSDGASALVVMSEEKALAGGMTFAARIVAYASSAKAPEWFTIAPAEAISALLRKTGHRLEEIDLFEIHEAFAASSIAVQRLLGLDPGKMNVRGGGVALGHPLGATGPRILTTLIHALADLDQQRGVAALCLGGGEALALMVERRI
jgi:acetyl-CoA C-acetyltransferase